MKTKTRKSRRKTLQRKLGNAYTSDHSLASPWAEWRADPNGYYVLLGLDPHTLVLQCSIRPAFLKAVRRWHPDGGDEGNAETFQRLLVAYSVLSNVGQRKAYDELGEDDLWIDEFVMQERSLKEREELYEMPWDALEQALGSLRPRRMATRNGHVFQSELPTWHDWTYYYEDEQFVPSRRTRERWLRSFATKLWHSGVVDEVRVGFTDSPRVEHRPWGMVFMVPKRYDAKVLATLYKDIDGVISAR